MEAIAIPFSFLVLVWVFGGLVAAALPVGVGAMGLALAIDYTLLIISRYRDELAGGADPDGALVRTVMTAGRTVLFSATTVALSMAAMIVFPMHFLKSFAYAGVATVGFAALAALVVAPAAIALLGPRLEALDVRRPVRRLLKRPEPMTRPLQQMFWYRWAKRVMHRAVPIGVAVVALLLLLGAPFLGVRWGFPDDRVLPTSASAHQVGDQLRNDFADDSATAVTAVIPDANGLAPSDVDGYAADLSRVSDVSSVSAPTGTFVGGARVGPPSAPTGEARGSAFLTISTSVPLFTAASETQLDRLHSVPEPADRGVDFTGTAQVNRDSVHAITSRLPLALSLIAVITFVLLFLLTGSVVLPLKALVLNVLSLSAAFGALVWIFRTGISGRSERRRPAHWWRTCRCCCSALPSVCRWTTRCS